MRISNQPTTIHVVEMENTKVIEKPISYEQTKNNLVNLMECVYQGCMSMSIRIIMCKSHTCQLILHGHELGLSEIKFLPLPNSTKQAVISKGIAPNRILEGI